MGYVQLEALMPDLRRQMDKTLLTGDIDLTWNVKVYLEKLSEDRAWNAASKLFPHCKNDLERFDAMLNYLFSQYTSVNFYPEIFDGFECSCSAHYQRFQSDTRFGALAKCVLYGEYFYEIARLERRGHLKEYRQSAVVKRIIERGSGRMNV